MLSTLSWHCLSCNTGCTPSSGGWSAVQIPPHTVISGTCVLQTPRQGKPSLSRNSSFHGLTASCWHRKLETVHQGVPVNGQHLCQCPRHLPCTLNACRTQALEYRCQFPACPLAVVLPGHLVWLSLLREDCQWGCYFSIVW